MIPTLHQDPHHIRTSYQGPHQIPTLHQGPHSAAPYIRVLIRLAHGSVDTLSET